MQFLILSKAHIVLCLNHIIYIKYNPEFKRATVWITGGKMVEVMEPQDYNDLVEAIDRLQV